jgi:hypothetical protein
MTDPEQDEAFESYLKRRSVLPDAPPDDRLEPPAALDATVLKQAREAVKVAAAPDTGKQQMQRAPRWAVPVALAATIMLCLSVVMNISLNTNRPTERLTAARDDGDRRESVPGDIPSREVILPEAKIAEAPAPHAPVVAEASESRELKRKLPASDAFAGGTQAARARAREQAPAYTGSAPDADKPSVAARSAADKVTTFERHADASVRGDAAAGGGAVARGTLQPANEGSQGAAAGGAQAATNGTQTAAADGRQAAAAGEPKHPADPKAWLRQIDALRAAGKNELADAEMGRFRAAFPGYAAKPATPASSEPPK